MQHPLVITPNPTDERLLWTQLKSGDRSAFAEIFARYHRTLYNYGTKLAPLQEFLVEDAIQDLFIDLWRLREGLNDSIESIKYYLYRALRRKIRLATERSNEWDYSPLVLEKALENEVSIETILIKNETNKQLKDSIKQLIRDLPDRQLEAITLRYFDNFSVPQIASIMNVTEKSVRNFLYKAKASLRISCHQLIDN